MDNDISDEIVGWISSSLTICFYLMQITLYIKVIKDKKRINDKEIFYITSCYYYCFLWFIYGETIYNLKIKIGHIISATICLFLICIYLINRIIKHFFDTILNIIILSMSSWAIYRYFTVEIDNDLITGKFCFGSSCIQNLLFLICLIKKNKNSNLIKYIQIIFYLIVSISWVFYGIISTDIYLILSYIIGIFISLIFISFYLNYKKKYFSYNKKYIDSSSIEIGNIINNFNIINESKSKIDDDEIKYKNNQVKIY